MGGSRPSKSQEEAEVESLSVAEAGGLVIGGLLVVGGVYAWFHIRRQVRMISRAMFGTPSLAKGLERQADMLAETPKSVSGMTKLCLPQIEADFPEFHWFQWKQMCENLLKAYLEGLGNQEVWRLENISGEGFGTGVGNQGAVSEELRKQLLLQIEDQKRRGVRQSYAQVKIHQTEISRYQKEAGMCIIKLQSAVEYFYKEIKEENKDQEQKENGASLGAERLAENRKRWGGKGADKEKGGARKGSDPAPNRKIQARYNMELVYIQDLSKVKDLATAIGVICPNCGAPITRLGSKFCEYCGTAVTPVDVRVWKLHRVEKEETA